MNDILTSNTEISAYFLWEYTGHHSALDLWYCAEDIALFFEKNRIFTKEKLKQITSLPKNEAGYISFVREIAYRVFIFTSKTDSKDNWFAAEEILSNSEWVDSILTMSKIYGEIREGETGVIDSIRSASIRKHFNV